MKVKELINQLQKCSPEAKVEVCKPNDDELGDSEWFNIEDVAEVDSEFVLVNLGNQTMG